MKHNATASSICKLTSCYNKCLKMFFGFKRRDSLTGILMQLDIPCFNTILSNGCAIFTRCYVAVVGTVLWNIYYLWVIDPLRLLLFKNDVMCFVSYVCMSFIA